jgi:hypothetical protein
LNTQPLREDNQCLNCGTIVPERYCTHCGQENTVPHESFGHLIKHFIADIVHFDSKTLNTLKYLMFRPGLLTTEYIKGRRASYVNPIKLYIFISFLFFLAYFAAPDTGVRVKIGTPTSQIGIDSIVHMSTTEALKQTVDKKDENKAFVQLLLNDLSKYPSVATYDSLQNTLPEQQKDGWWKTKITHRYFYLYEKYGDTFFDATGDKFKHNIPKMMFLLLPLFALYLKIMYDKKRWYYTDHAIFSIHIHSFAFVLFLVTLIVDWITKTDWFSSLGLIISMVYLIAAMKRTYQQSLLKSITKGLILWFGYMTSMVIVLLGLMLLVMAFIL